MKQWYVIQTQPHAEEKAAFHLRRQGYDVYAPRYRRRRRHALREEIVARSLFPNYLFVALDLQGEPWRSVNSTVGVIGLVCAGFMPLPLGERVIESMRTREDSEGFIQIAPQSVRSGESVRVTNGAFADCVGIFHCVDDDVRVTLLLSLMGRPVKVRVNAEDLARVA